MIDWNERYAVEDLIERDSKLGILNPEHDIRGIGSVDLTIWG